MEKKKCTDCRNPDCRRLRALAISMLESDPEYPWPPFKAPMEGAAKPAATL